MPGRATAPSAPAASRVAHQLQGTAPSHGRGHHSLSPGTRVAADGVRGNSVVMTSHSAVVAGGRPQGVAPAAQTTRNRPPPQDYVLQHGLYRRPHHSMPPQGPQSPSGGAPVQTQVRQQHSSHQLPQTKVTPSGGPFSKLPVHYNVGGSSGSTKKKSEKPAAAEYSDDDELAPGSFFSKKKLSLLVRCISFIHQEITSSDDMPPHAMELRQLYTEEQYHISNCRTDLRGWRRSLGDTNPLEIANFVLGLFENGFFEVSELICCLIFLRRFREKTGLRMDAACWRPLFLAALLVTDKYLIDSSVKGSSMSEQSMFPVLSPSQVFSLELTFWKSLDFGRLWLTRRDFRSFCQELELQVPESFEVARFVKSHNYVKSDTFTWGESKEVQAHDFLQGHSKSHSKSGATLNHMQFQTPSNGVTVKPVQPWKPRQTVYVQHVDSKEDVDALAIRDGISPRRRNEKVPDRVPTQNGSKPRANSQPFVGERNPTKQLGTSGSLGYNLRSSPRQQVSSGPCLVAEVHETRDDPSLLSFAEKTHIFNVRSQSQSDPRRPQWPSQMMSRPMVGGPYVQRPFGGSTLDPKSFTFTPNMRSTIHTTKPCVQPPPPTVSTRMERPQQLTPPGPQGYTAQTANMAAAAAQHARGRSSSPAYVAGPPGHVTTQRHVMYVHR